MKKDTRAWSLLTTLQGSRRTRIQTCLHDKKDRWDMLKHALKVQDGLDSKDYNMLLDALDCNDSRMVHETDLIEQSLLAMLYDMKLDNTQDQKFKAAVDPYDKKFVSVAKALAKARSLDIEISTRNLQNRHAQLVDYVSRIHLSREVVTDNQEFWDWLENGYSSIYRFLKVDDELRLNRANTFVHMLGAQFNNMETSAGHMSYVNSICQRIMELCSPSVLKEYSRKICDSYGSAIGEMKMLAILDREFQHVKIEPRMPQSSKVADLSIKFEGETYFVEIYTATTFTFVGTLSKFRVNPKDDWEYLLGKKQVKELKKTDTPTIFVLNVGREYLDRIETCTPGFREYVCKMMPSRSELVVMRNNDDVEVMSVRDGHIVEKTSLGLALESAIERGWERAPLPQAS